MHPSHTYIKKLRLDTCSELSSDNIGGRQETNEPSPAKGKGSDSDDSFNRRVPIDINTHLKAIWGFHTIHNTQHQHQLEEQAQEVVQTSFNVAGIEADVNSESYLKVLMSIVGELALVYNSIRAEKEQGTDTPMELLPDRF